MKKESLKMIRNIMLFLCLIFLTFYFILKDQDINTLFKIMESTNKWFLICGMFSMFLFFFFEALNIRYILKAYNDKISVSRALKYTFIGNFFSAITPASSGGQPMEIYYMTKDNVSGAHGTIALLIEICGYHISSLLIGVLCVIFYPATIQNGLLWLLIVGLTIKICALTLLLIFIFSPKATNRLLGFLKWILRLFNFKDIDVKESKLHASLKKYEESSIFIKNHKSIFIKSLIYTFFQIIFLHLVNYFVYCSFGFNTLSVFELFAIQAVLFDMVAGIPLPGAVGISEITYLHMYELAYSTEFVSSAMLLARGINFYSYVIVSLIVVVVNHIYITRRSKKNSHI